ncbi:MAG TPA: FtsX-like permease family protein, partial [Methylomirabilota bacterium]|nr:FtsX-like permease family protein [Methylomirabilota bacterium]
MTFRTLILRSLGFHWRSHVGVVLGAAVGSAALVGALVVGDSVKQTLRERALQRVGWVEMALAPSDRFFTQAAVSNAAANLPPGSPYRLASALRLPGTATRQDGSARANRIQILGVTPAFWNAEASAAVRELPPRGVVLNEALAAQLRAVPGDDLVLRLHKPSALSRDVPISPRSDASVALRVRVHAIATAADLGDFNLHASPGATFNAFVPLADLDAAAGLRGRANLLLLGRDQSRATERDARSLEAFTLDHLRNLADLELELLPLAGGREVELRSTRIFLDPPVLAAARTESPRPILTYLVNLFRAGSNTVPYSMVTAAGPPLVPADLAEDEIVVNRWLAEELEVEPGRSIELSYYLPDSGAPLIERTNRFRVRAVVPIEGRHADRQLMPEFPGLAKAESTHDWDAGFPLEHPIRDQDEAYWKQHRGTPKAFVSLAAGRRLWGSRFGDATAVRWEVPPGRTVSEFRAVLETNLLAALRPGELGLNFEPVRAQALAASAGSQDFGGLFLGFSFFLIAAALILMGLLFQFHLEQRASEIGTLLALGFTPKRVRRLLLGEGLGLALVGGLLGTAGGVAYARGMIQGLTTTWRDAIASVPLGFHVTGGTLALGVAAGVVVCGLTFLIVLRRQARQPARALLAGGAAESGAGSGTQGRLWPGAASGAVVCLSGAAGLVVAAVARGETANAGVFFGAGALLLAGGLLASAVGLRRLAGSA